MIRLDDAELMGFVTLGAKTLGLSLSPAIFTGVTANTAILFDHAARVMAFDLPTETDLGVDFWP